MAENFWKGLEVFGLVIALVSGLIMLLIFIFGSPQTGINQNQFITNEFFDMCVLGTFVGLITFTAGNLMGK